MRTDSGRPISFMESSAAFWSSPRGEHPRYHGTLARSRVQAERPDGASQP